MKRTDLVKGEVYAWNISATYGTALPVTVVDNTTLYEQERGRYRRPDGEIKPSSRRVNNGDDYPYIKVGILVETKDGGRDLVNPAHLRMPWDQWLVQQQVQTEREQRQRTEKRAKADADRVVRARLSEVLARTPYADRIPQDSHPTRTAVPNEVLIEILEQLDHA